MRYYVREISQSGLRVKTAGVKARADAEKIFEQNGLKALEIPILIDNREKCSASEKLKVHFELYHLWKNKLSNLDRGDSVYIQFPLIEHTLLFYRVVKEVEKFGIQVILLIHDIESIRSAMRSDISYKEKIRLKYEEYSVFDKCSQIIVHNCCMKRFLKDKLGICEKKMVVLEIFDYLIAEYDEARMQIRSIQKDRPVIIAGSLLRHKAGYVYHLPDNQKFNLYGIGYEKQDVSNISYRGAFKPDELPYVLDGSFGLVWDGEDSEGCNGIYGSYLRVNNPHKTSLYLAAGIPVIIWKEAALAKFVEEKGCGISVDSLYHINDIMNSLQERDYMRLKRNAEIMGGYLRQGYFLSKTLGETK